MGVPTSVGKDGGSPPAMVYKVKTLLSVILQMRAVKTLLTDSIIHTILQENIQARNVPNFVLQSANDVNDICKFPKLQDRTCNSKS